MGNSTVITDPQDPRLMGDTNTEDYSRSRKKRMAKKFTLPTGCDCESFVVRELNGNDEIDAAVMADKSSSDLVKDSPIAQFGAERRESLRLSLVEVDGKPVPQPYLEMNHWSLKTLRVLMAAFNDLNGLDEDDLKNCLASAEVVSAR